MPVPGPARDTAGESPVPGERRSRLCPALLAAAVLSLSAAGGVSAASPAGALRGFPHPPAFRPIPPDTVTVRDEAVEERMEEIIGEEDPERGESEGEALSLALLRLAENPVNLNRGDLWALLQLPGMNLRLAQAILDYRIRSKPFERVDELTGVPGIGPATLERFRPYLTVGEGRQLRGLLYRSPRYWTHGARLEIISRLRGVGQRKEGYRRGAGEGGYAGSPLHFYQRLVYGGDHLSAGLILEKDAGEALPGAGSFDYRSWHLALKDAGRLKRLVVGDYTLSLGQGLLMRGGGLYGKGPEVIGTALRGGGGIRPHTSAAEGTAMRGAAATVGDRLRFTAFWSARRHSASVSGPDTTGPPRTDGYHRTPAERSARGRLRREMYGGRLQLRLGRGVIGAGLYRTRYGAYVDPGPAPWQRDRFRGRRSAAGGADFAFPLGPLLLFGEAARSAGGGWAAVAGMEGAASRETRLTAVYRHYGTRFHSPMGGGFGERSGSPGNEEGFYLGLSHQAGGGVELRGYVDHFHFPGPRFGVSRPSGGVEWLGLLRWKPDRDTEAYLRFRSERKEDEYASRDSSGREVRLTGNAFRQTWRLQLQHRVNPRVRLRARLEVARGRPAGPPAGIGDRDTAAGYLLFQDLRLKPGGGITLDARLTFFHAPTYESRIYQFENNLLHVLTNQLLYGTGERFYLLLRLRAGEYVDLWARAGTTRYRDRRTVGSGLEAIEGNRKTDLGLQLRLRF